MLSSNRDSKSGSAVVMISTLGPWNESRLTLAVSSRGYRGVVSTRGLSASSSNESRRTPRTNRGEEVDVVPVITRLEKESLRTLRD